MAPMSSPNDLVNVVPRGAPRAAGVGGAGSPGGFSFGQPLGSAQLNNAFATKQDFIGVVGAGPLIGQTNAQLITPDLGVPTAIDLTNATNLPPTALSGLGSGVAAALGQAVTGTGGMVLANGHTLVAPNLGQPASADLTHATNLPIAGITGLGAGVPAALALAVNGTGAISGTTNVALVTPNLGTPSAINLANAVAVTQPPADNSTKPATTAFVATATAAVSASAYAFRNRLINGDMRIDQRYAGAAVVPSAMAYTVDRWAFQASQYGKITVQQNIGGGVLPAGSGLTNYLGCSVTTTTTVGANDLFILYQVIEGFNVADLMWGTANAQPITLSFWAASNIAGTFGGCLRNTAANRSYPFSFSLPGGTTWTRVVITIPGDTSGTWATNNGTGITLNFCMGVGSTYGGPPGAWAAANYVGVAGQTNIVTTNGGNFILTGVQLEVGSTATPFERRPYSVELYLCWRYFQSLGYNIVSGYQGAGGSIYGTSFNYYTPMRITPTITFSNVIYNNGSGLTLWSGTDTSHMGVLFTVTTTAYGYSQFTYTADAEL
jgi:hypothetical protein